MQFFVFLFTKLHQLYDLLDRFSEALSQFSEALLLCESKTNPRELTWPTTSVPVKDAQIEDLLVFI